jgi:hypothetical protein
MLEIFLLLLVYVRLQAAELHVIQLVGPLQPDGFFLVECFEALLQTASPEQVDPCAPPKPPRSTCRSWGRSQSRHRGRGRQHGLDLRIYLLQNDLELELMPLAYDTE